MPLLGGLTYDRLRALKTLGYFPNIRSPRTFNEKLLHRKFFRPIPNSAMLADKWLVRSFVKEHVGEHVLNEVLAVTDDPDALDFKTLPKAFVVKMNNASNRTVIVFDKGALDIPGVRAKLRYWLHSPFGRQTSESFYLDIKPLVLVERIIGDGKRLPKDYKLHVFDGRVAYIEVVSEHMTRKAFENFIIMADIKPKARFYDRDWQPQNFTNGEPLADLTPRPPNLSELIEVAECVAHDFDYIRIDLYTTGSHVIFGELTLVPAAGHAAFVPRKIDFELGALWTHPKGK